MSWGCGSHGGGGQPGSVTGSACSPPRCTRSCAATAARRWPGPTPPPGYGSVPPGQSQVVRRYEHDAPGDMIRVDVKKLGRIADGGGHRIHGRQQGKKNRRSIKHGYWYIHNGCRRPLTPGLLRTPHRRTQRDRGRILEPRPGILRGRRDHGRARPDRQRFLLPLEGLRQDARRRRDHSQAHAPLPTPDQRQGRNGSTAPCSRNGPTPGPTSARANEQPRSPRSSTPTITTEATPHWPATPSQTAYPT